MRSFTPAPPLRLQIAALNKIDTGSPAKVEWIYGIGMKKEPFGKLRVTGRVNLLGEQGGVLIGPA